MIKIILYLWQLPQNLVGLFMLAFHYICGHKPEKYNENGVAYYKAKHVNDCGVSLGNYIFLDSDFYWNYDTIKHEHGHQIQSKILGPLYLLVIGIPSGIHNLISRKTDCNYYHFYTEKWANKLGEVDY